jgi:hypothetical protein
MKKIVFILSMALITIIVSAFPAFADFCGSGIVSDAGGCQIQSAGFVSGSASLDEGSVVTAGADIDTAYEVPGQDPDEPRVSITNPVVREYEDKCKKGEYKKVLSGKVSELNMNTGYFVASWVQAHGMPAGMNKELVYWDPSKPTKLPIVFGNQTKYMIEKVIKPGDSSPVPVKMKYPYKTWVSCSRGEILWEGANVEVFYKQEGSINRAYLILGHKRK